MGNKKLADLLISLGYGNDTNLAENPGVAVIDMYSFIYRWIKSKTVTMRNGRSISHISRIHQFINSLIKANIHPICVFDNSIGPHCKSMTLTKRKATNISYADKCATAKNRLEKITENMENNIVDINNTYDDINEIKEDIDRFSRYSIRLDKDTIDDCIKYLCLRGITYILAPPGTDGEQVCAWVYRDLMLNTATRVYTISSDIDVIAYGSPLIRAGQNGKFTLYDLETIYKEQGLNRKKIARIAVALGTDFNNCIGIRRDKIMAVQNTLRSRIRSSEDAEVSYNFIYKHRAIYEHIYNDENMPELRKWCEINGLRI
jgi:5'-3' exonuclease